MGLLHMVELRLDLGQLMRFLQGQGLTALDAGEDLGYGVHAWLAAAFGPMAPKPWRLLVDRRRPPRILGYAACGADILRQRLREFAEPSVAAVCPDPDTMMVSKVMPEWRPGRRLAFEVLCCPVGRRSTDGVEKDLFLIHVDAAPRERLSRHAVYEAWARERLERSGAATVVSIRLAGFRLVRQTRQSQGTGQRKRSHLVRPQVLLRGELTVGNPEAFTDLLAKGIGRHRAFGYGMVLLGPAS